MPVQTATFRVYAIPAETLDRVRAAGRDDFGNELRPEISREAHQLRCCLRHSGVGERIALIKYSPFEWDGVYAESGPVFIHVDRCAGYGEPDAFPEAFRGSPRILRAYGPAHSIVDAKIAEGEGLEPAIAELFARGDVDTIHVRNVKYGCFIAAITRD